MKLPPNAPQVIEYRCNLCGGKNQLDSRQFHRELAACKKCGALARFRGIIHALANFLGENEDAILREWPIRKDIFGVGMSDWNGYAKLLRRKFSYENSFYDRKPQLDILNLTEKHLGRYDFVISTDVFEHILPPLQQGFDNLFRLLKSGGCLIFSVPCTRTAQTVEHYPGLLDYEILNFRGTRIIVNRDDDGCLQVYDNPVFHGGKGATLEMHIFCEADILNRLAQSGFEDIKVHDQPQLSMGYYWPELKSADRMRHCSMLILSAPVASYYFCLALVRCAALNKMTIWVCPKVTKWHNFSFPSNGLRLLFDLCTNALLFYSCN